MEKNSESAMTKPKPEAPSPAAEASSPVVAKSGNAADHPAESAVVGASQPTSILPDETKQRVRPEDFLPFFQFPGGQSAPGANAPGTIPPSSATYKMQ
jgi:hypothetical protein